MAIFLKVVAGVFIGLLLLVIAIYFYVKWKIRSLFKTLGDAISGLSFGEGEVPPFRIKVRKRSDIFGDEEDFGSNNRLAFEGKVKEFEAIGFEKIDDFFIEEIYTSMTAMVHRDTTTYGVVYDHPVANVWCDIVRSYTDQTGWTLADNNDHLMDRPPWSTQNFFPEEPLGSLFEKFQDQAPGENIEQIRDEDFAKNFEKKYAREMDWRISRDGVTEAEIRRIAKRDGVDCTPEHVSTIQIGWQDAIAEFMNERVLKRYRKDQKLSRSEWEMLEEDAVVIHERLQAEIILQSFDGEFYSGALLEDEYDDEEERQDYERWNLQLVEIRESLKQNPPQKVFKQLVEASQNNEVTWEFKASVQKPFPADIWLRHYVEDDDDDEVDDFDDE